MVMVTAPSEEEANLITEHLLNSRLAACVNRVDEVRSAFWWQGAKKAAHETMLIIKTQASMLDAVVAAVKAKHSYSVPEIIAFPIVGGNPEYLGWIGQETRERQG
ncbi:MAG: divalent-cation tolerance protein CutA [Chloroflexi bacterium]|nr:divalent-cation tolerance protein CutA [Chloroflexota bacterium]